MLAVSIIIVCAIVIALIKNLSPSKKSEAVAKGCRSPSSSNITRQKSSSQNRQPPSVSAKKAETAVDETVPLKLSIPRPSEQQNQDVEITCDKTGKQLKHNLYQMTCSCDEFGTNHVLYPIGDIRRLCKHLTRAYNSVMDLNALDMFKKAIIKRGHSVKANFLYLGDKNDTSVGETVLIQYDKEHPWWDIYVNSGASNLQCYGFNILSNSWSHNQPPPMVGDDLVKAVENILHSGEYKIDSDLLKVREIVSKVNTKQQLRNLEKRLQRAEQKYTADSTPVQDKKYDILCKAWEVAENKMFWLDQDSLKAVD